MPPIFNNKTSTPMFGDESQILPILQTQEKELKAKLPSVLGSKISSPTKDFNAFLSTGDESFKTKATQSLGILQEAVTKGATRFLFGKEFPTISDGAKDYLSQTKNLVKKGVEKTKKSYNEMGTDKSMFTGETITHEEKVKEQMDMALNFSPMGMAKVVKPVLGGVEKVLVRSYNKYKSSNDFRNGTWFSVKNKEGFPYNEGNIGEGFGGKNSMETKTKLSNPYIINLPYIQQESRDAFYSLLKNESLFSASEKLLIKENILGQNTPKTVLVETLKKLGVESKFIKNITTNNQDNELIYDVIMSTKLKKLGYDSLVIKGKVDDYYGEGMNPIESVFNFSKDTPSILAGAIKEAPSVFQGFKDLSTKVLEDLKGRSTVSKQYIQDATNRPELKDAERNVIRQVLDTMPDKTLNVQDFADRVKAELLPLEVKTSSESLFAGRAHNNFETNAVSRPKYGDYVLKGNLSGDVKDYKENIYNSPIKTSAGSKHFGTGTPNYFGHTRVEDMADNSTRRVIEVQSDLYQKGGLEKEIEKSWSSLDEAVKHFQYQGKSDPEALRMAKLSFDNQGGSINKLQQYNDPTAHFRMIREEIKKAAQDGKSKLQFPTGETAMKVEGLGQRDFWKVVDENGKYLTHTGEGNSMRRGSNMYLGDDIAMKEGMQITQGVDGGDWIITEVLGDGKFKAISKNSLEQYDMSAAAQLRERTPSSFLSKIQKEDPEYLDRMAETFDISGKVDQNNPIYKFYEKEVGKYLKKFDAKLVTDKQGVNWWEVPITKEHATQPVQAFGKVKVGAILGGAGAATGAATIFGGRKKEERILK